MMKKWVDSSISEEDVSHDHISKLPVDILTSILSLLPLEEAARTTVLSSRWQHLFSVSPLDIDACSLHGQKSCRWWVGAIDGILSRHRGSIRSFRLCNCPCINHLPEQDRLDSWMETLDQRGIQNLSTFYYHIPSRFVSFRSLRSLGLRRCDLRQGLVRMPPNLRELKIKGCLVTGKSLSDIISSCRVLDTLEIAECNQLHRMRVSAQCLKKLTFGKRFYVSDLCIEDVPNLELLMFDPLFGGLASLRIIDAPKLRRIDFLSAVFNTIHFGQTCFQNGLPLNFSRRVHSLKVLVIRANLYDDRQAKALSGLLRSFPRLESLDILSVVENLGVPIYSGYWDQESSSDCLDHHLKLVKIKGFLGQQFEIGFARFIIRNAGVLKMMSLLSIFRCRSWKKATLLQLGLENRASLDAQVSFERDDENYSGAIW